MNGAIYMDEHGDSYGLVQEPLHFGWYVCRMSGRVTSRFKAIRGSKQRGVVAARLSVYAGKHGLISI